MANNTDVVVNYFIGLSYKLGKIPTLKECNKHNLTQEHITACFESFKDLKEAALESHPALQLLNTPTKLSVSQVDSLRIDEANKNTKKDNASLVTDVSTLDYIATFAQRVFSGKIKPTTTPKAPKKIKRVHHLVLSDLHFGSDLKGDETGAGSYGIDEETQRLGSVIKAASLYKKEHRKDTKLNVLLIGDIIENQLHDARTGATLAEQSCRAIHLLTQAIAYLATQYPVVEVHCATGNHGRNTSRHHGRAIHQKFDSIETIIYYSIKSAISNLKNVTVNIPKTPMGSYEELGIRFAYTHGDTVLNVSSPGTSLNVRGIENSVNKINASLPDAEEYKVFIYGHSHVAHNYTLGNGVTLVGNGALVPPDHYATSLGIMETGCGQYIFETVVGEPVEDIKLLKPKKEVVNIITPWSAY